MRSKEYRRELNNLNKQAWIFYRRYLCHQSNKYKTGIEETMKIILDKLQLLKEEADSIYKQV